MHPHIRLKDILISVFLMPYWGIKALLQLDILLRTPQMLRLFRCTKKKVVVSDTTIARVLSWLDPQDSRQALLAPPTTLNNEGLLQLRLAPNGPSRRLGVIDGSQMGDHYLVAALLCGQLNYPVPAEPCKGRGHEQKTTQALLPIIHQMLGPAAPQLWLFDALYFNQPIFRIVAEQQAHLLIKYSPHEDGGGVQAVPRCAGRCQTAVRRQHSGHRSSGRITWLRFQTVVFLVHEKNQRKRSPVIR
jgi:hypothetical protein